jgi:hypothetical protein
VAPDALVGGHRRIHADAGTTIVNTARGDRMRTPSSRDVLSRDDHLRVSDRPERSARSRESSVEFPRAPFDHPPEGVGIRVARGSVSLSLYIGSRQHVISTSLRGTKPSPPILASGVLSSEAG